MGIRQGSNGTKDPAAANWDRVFGGVTAFSSHRHELSEAWQRVREAIIWGFSASAMTHAERRHVRRCERAKVNRPFWPRR